MTHVKDKTPKPRAPLEEGGEDPNKDVPSLLEFLAALGEGASLAALPAPIRAGVPRSTAKTAGSATRSTATAAARARLQHLLGKRDKPWLVGHFKDPKKLVPDSP